MSSLAKIIHREVMQELAQEGEARRLGKILFQEWRDRYVAQLCAYMRTYAAAERFHISLPKPYKGWHWCNAAVHILTVSPEDLQDWFLTADDATKTKLVNAVLEDKGVVDINGHFHELPPK